MVSNIQEVILMCNTVTVFRADQRLSDQKYCKEVIICKQAKHPNILSIEGVAPRLFEFCMVSQWMPNGNMLGYVERHPEVNRLELVGLMG